MHIACLHVTNMLLRAPYLEGVRCTISCGLPSLMSDLWQGGGAISNMEAAGRQAQLHDSACLAHVCAIGPTHGSTKAILLLSAQRV